MKGFYSLLYRHPISAANLERNYFFAFVTCSFPPEHQQFKALLYINTPQSGQAVVGSLWC